MKKSLKTLNTVNMQNIIISSDVLAHVYAKLLGLKTEDAEVIIKCMNPNLADTCTKQLLGIPVYCDANLHAREYYTVKDMKEYHGDFMVVDFDPFNPDGTPYKLAYREKKQIKLYYVWGDDIKKSPYFNTEEEAKEYQAVNGGKVDWNWKRTEELKDQVSHKWVRLEELEVVENAFAISF